jgi:enoyl-CoA hydratase/carnithine racemase
MLSGLETLRYEEKSGVAHVTLLRDRVDVRVVRELAKVSEHLEDDAADVRAVVFRGSNGTFCRGIDFRDFDPNGDFDIHGFNLWEKICARIERLPKATIVLLEGDVIGAGVQLALVCDARLALPSARLQLDEVHLGFLPGMATFRLAKYVGLGHAKRLIMRCPTIGAEEARTLGIVDEIVTDADTGIAEAIRSFGPIHTVAVELSRRLLNESFGTSFEDAIGHFLAAQHRSIRQTAFLETVKKQKKPRT